MLRNDFRSDFYYGITFTPFDRIKNDDEIIYWMGRPNKFCYMMTSFPFLLIGFIGLCFGFWDGFDITLGNIAIVFISLIFGLFGIRLLRYNWLSYRNTFYAISNKRILIQTGTALPEIKTYPYEEIQTIRLNCGILESRDGAGTIIFFLVNNNNDPDRAFKHLQAVKPTQELYNKICELHSAIKSKSGPNDTASHHDRSA